MPKRPRINKPHIGNWKHDTGSIPGIFLRSRGRVIAHLTPHQAFNLADTLVDLAEQVQGGTNHEQPHDTLP